MSIDLSQFHQVFFEESYEGLDVMESALLNLQPENIDSEVINEIFRAAHSIKGGSGTFGFNDVADFTHVVETLLDEIRSETRVMMAETVELLLKSVDCIRKMIQQHDAGNPFDATEANSIKGAFETLLSTEQAHSNDPLTQVDSNTDESEVTTEISAQFGWNIYFKPHIDILKTGNDPLRMFRELESLGPLTVSVDATELPPISSIDAEACYLSWTLELKADVPKSSIDEAFEWVAEESELSVTPITALDDSEEIEPPSGSSTPSPEPKNVDITKVDVTSIRVGVDKVDELINMVGELVITQSMLGELGGDFTLSRLPQLLEGIEQLSQNTRDLQESVMRIRMLPISFTFSRFPRLVHDLSRTMGKKINLVLSGEQTELDKTVMEKIGDPLVHLIRNSLDHGIETPEERIKLGKPETGIITLNAFHQGGKIVIQIIDDGAGLNKAKIIEKAKQKNLIPEEQRLTNDQIHDLIFKPGFSTAELVSDISGRGVGMDVVRRNINELNGSVEVESIEGKGSTFTIRLPLTLAILEGQLIRVGRQIYILPLIAIIESIQSYQSMVHRVVGGCDLLRLRDEYVPIIQLSSIFNVSADAHYMEDGLLVVVEGDNMKVALFIDDLDAQQQVVIKSLEENYKKVAGVSGATILGNGTVSLILDIVGLIELAGVQRQEYRVITDGGDDCAA